MVANAFHSAKTSEHYTPASIINRARRVLGDIDVDPASCDHANKHVQATEYFTAENDGLGHEWHGRVFLNPPGTCGLRVCGNAKVCSCKLVDRFWAKLFTEYNERRVDAGIWVGYSVQQLQSLQATRYSPLAFPICYPFKRVAYSGKSPPHASYIAYLGDHVARFDEAFGNFGTVVIP